MKKISILLIAIISAKAAFAQETPQPVLRTPMEVKTRFGIKAGANIARYHVSKDEYANQSQAPNANTKTSLFYGAFVNIPIGGMLRFQPELVFSQQGSKINEKIGANSFSYEEDLYYVNFPLLIQLHGQKGFFAEAGPQLGFLTKARTQGKTNISTTENTDIKFMRDKFDLALSAGVGYLTRVGLGINARYNFGLANVVEENGSNANNQGELKNRVVQIGLHYHFGANK